MSTSELLVQPMFGGLGGGDLQWTNIPSSGVAILHVPCAMTKVATVLLTFFSVYTLVVLSAHSGEFNAQNTADGAKPVERRRETNLQETGRKLGE